MQLSDGAQLWTASTTVPGSAGVVLIHGGPGMWDYLAPLADLMDGLASTHRYDQRGCGRSSPDDDYRIARFVADLDELREHFGYEQWLVIGHSFGATPDSARRRKQLAIGYKRSTGPGTRKSNGGPFGGRRILPTRPERRQWRRMMR